MCIRDSSNGLDGAADAFKELYKAAGAKGPVPERITSAYLRGLFTVKEWRRVIELDEQWEVQKKKWKGKHWMRCVYRIWPDFKVKALIDRSVATVKADAAFKS